MGATTAMMASRGSAGAARPRRPRRRGSSQGTLLTAGVFLLPAVAMLILLRILPMGEAIVASLQRDALAIDGGEWVGLANYIHLLTSSHFWGTVGVTVVFLVITVPLQILIALGLALLLSEKLSGVGLVRVLVFIPVAAPGAVAALVWGVAFRPDGPINAVLGVFGIGPQPFLTSPGQALAAIIVLMSWIGIGYWTIFLLAGVQSVPAELYEAASIDGAGWWRCLFSITLPSMTRQLLFVVVANTVASALAFVPVQILTQGGPAGSTRLYMFDLYNRTFLLGDVSVGQAQVVLLVIALIGIATIQFRMLTRKS